MKMSKLAYIAADRLYAATENTDRANRGVRLEGWTIAALFSAAVWVGVFLLVKFIF